MRAGAAKALTGRSFHSAGGPLVQTRSRGLRPTHGVVEGFGADGGKFYRVRPKDVAMVGGQKAANPLIVGHGVALVDGPPGAPKDRIHFGGVRDKGVPVLGERGWAGPLLTKAGKVPRASVEGRILGPGVCDTPGHLRARKDTRLRQVGRGRCAQRVSRLARGGGARWQGSPQVPGAEGLVPSALKETR